MRLLLFDIDGTLLTADGSSRGVIEQALSGLTGRSITTDDVSFSGKTDPAIMREILTSNGIPPSMIEQVLPQALQTYAELARSTIRQDTVRLLEGVSNLLGELEQEASVALSLLTGNLESTAKLKLEAGGIAHYFRGGAYGSDHANRNRLPEVARHRAQQSFERRFAASDITVIGDTPRDIACGRAAGCFTVAVATGRFSASELQTHQPDLLFHNLKEVRVVADALMKNP